MTNHLNHFLLLLLSVALGVAFAPLFPVGRATATSIRCTSLADPMEVYVSTDLEVAGPVDSEWDSLWVERGLVRLEREGVEEAELEFTFSPLEAAE